MGNCCLSPAPPNSTSTVFDKLSSLSLCLCRSWNTSNSTNSGASNCSGNTTSTAGSGSVASFNEGQISPESNLRIFAYLELKTATENFQENRLLGDGGFGGVYKAWIDGIVLAVKKLNAKTSEGFEEWESEVTFLGRLSHPNLVKLVGYCWEQKELLLVYEYIPNGSLGTHLFGRGSSVLPLTWDLRIKIAIGAARGLSFLHTAKQVIYKDFRTSNILLDAFYNPKLSDFGLAKTRMHGYAAPEYVSTVPLYVKNDVYGFGVVLAEILTGLRALDPDRPGEQFSLVNWVTPYLSDRRKLKKVMDPRLKGKYPYDAALQTASLALKCLALEPRDRPSMEEVLEKLMDIKSTSEKPP